METGFIKVTCGFKVTLDFMSLFLERINLVHIHTESLKIQWEIVKYTSQATKIQQVIKKMH